MIVANERHFENLFDSSETYMTELTSHCCAAVVAKLKIKLALAVLRETAVMGHALGPARLHLEQARHDYISSAPLLVCGFEIWGEVNHALNNQKSEQVICQQMEKRCFMLGEVTLDFAKQVAIETFSVFKLETQVELKHIGDYTPKEIVLIDAFGSTVGLFMGKAWEKPTPPAVWSFMERSAIKARQEAATESAEMNNAEAQELLKQARYLDNLLSLSKAHHSGRIVQGKFEEKNSDISVASGGKLAAHA